MSSPRTPPPHRVSSDTGRSSLLSRLSLSPSKRQAARNPTPYQPIDTALSPNNQLRSTDNRRPQTLLPGTDSASRGGGVRNPLEQPNVRTVTRHAVPSPLLEAPPSQTSPFQQGLPTASKRYGSDQKQVDGAPASYLASDRSSNGQTKSLSRARQPIYPALASPPREKNHRAGSVAPMPFSDQRERAGAHLSLTDDQAKQVASNASSPPRANGTHAHRVKPAAQQTTMQIIASSGARVDRDTTTEKPSHRYDKQGRPMMSARRSAGSSSRTVTRVDTASKFSIPSPTASPDSLGIDKTSPLKTGFGLTEASAYAKAVSSHLVRPDQGDFQHRAKSAEIPLHSRAKSHHVRPLPRPPNAVSDPADLPRRRLSGVKASDLATGGPSAPSRNGSPAVPSNEANKAGSRQSHAMLFDFPRSPTIPALVDPRHTPGAGTENSGGDHPQASSPDLQPASSHPGHVDGSIPARRVRTRGVKGAELSRPSGKLSLQHLLSHATIQSALLSAISINAFLSLTGSTEVIRHQFTGESVGRWVLQEWAVHVPSPFGARWPNLTVWEGFLESLLHNPATYSTYPARWHNLLRHLSLSHSLVVLFLRNLPSSCFPNHSLLPFEDEGPSITSLPFSSSSTSLASMGQPRSRVGSAAGSDTASLAPSSKPPRRERVIEIVMPEPLAAQPQEEIVSPAIESKPIRRRGSISSLASAASFSFGRRRSNSNALDARPSSRLNGFAPMAEPTASMAPGKGAPPPVSYPTAKRYGFTSANDATSRGRQSSLGRPGSVFSMQTSPSISSYAPHMSQIAPGVSQNWQHPLPAPPPLSVRPRSSFGSADSHRRSDRDRNSPVPNRRAGFPGTTPPKCEPAFDRPMPYLPGRVPVLRVFVPLSEAVRRWPSAEGAIAAVEELEKCGALKRMQLGDLIVNTAIRTPRTTEHVLVYVPFVKHLLVPLQYVHNSTGHLPSYVDAFALPPSYYYPFLPAPQVIYLNLGPYREQGLRSMRLASDRRDMTIASGAKISAKRYLYVAGVEIRVDDKAAPEWQGMVSLEAEGTAEGKSDLEGRFGVSQDRKAPLAPWEIVKEKSMGGTVWLRLLKEKPA